MFKVWYHDNRTFAEYLIETTKLNEHDPEIERISTGRDFANNPDMIQKILYLDMPDAVVTYGFPEKPILGIEFCAEAPFLVQPLHLFSRKRSGLLEQLEEDGITTILL